ncbi:hypothetical protein PC5_00139 [Campylobacter phage PC5]|uniref:DNA methyltransferase n=1 Tax=Campylobacter phage PC5 TaxID=1541690 RepID=A0A1B0XVT8_9CAUD|nr:hypothetical protein PC5_00139 [Campylobacter phage PC5]
MMVKMRKKIRLKNNGDFRSNECIETLLKSDIVVTNPPFSLFREFMNTLLEYSKDFIIIGNFTGITYKNILPNFLNNKIYFGKSKRGMSFVIPDSNNLKSVNAVWFTTFYTERKLLTLTKVYNPNDFEKYDNTDIINIDNIKDIPINYYGLMGVPITFLEKYDANKFEVVNLARNLKINGVIKYYRIIIKRKV